MTNVKLSWLANWHGSLKSLIVFTYVEMKTPSNRPLSPKLTRTIGSRDLNGRGRPSPAFIGWTWALLLVHERYWGYLYGRMGLAHSTILGLKIGPSLHVCWAAESAPEPMFYPCKGTGPEYLPL